MVPQRLEQHIAEAERQQVLHRFLAEIMVDPIGLLFPEDRLNGVVDHAARGEIMADRFLERDPGARTCETGGLEPPNGVGIERGRRGQENRKPVVPGVANRRGERGEARRIGHINGHVVEAVQKAFNLIGHDLLGREEAGQCLGDLSAKRRVIDPPPGRSDNPQVRRDQPIQMEAVERRQQHTPGEVAAGPEQHHRVRRSVRARLCVTIVDIFHLSSCPESHQSDFILAKLTTLSIRCSSRPKAVIERESRGRDSRGRESLIT